jgi:hypothetical protein
MLSFQVSALASNLLLRIAALWLSQEWGCSRDMLEVSPRNIGKNTHRVS